MKILKLLTPMLFLVFSGCTTGILFSHTVSPLDLNQNQTQIVLKSKEGNIKHFSLGPFLRFPVGAAWDSGAIGDIAERKGLETIYYADIEILRILLFWSQYTVHVYGEEGTNSSRE